MEENPQRAESIVIAPTEVTKKFGPWMLAKKLVHYPNKSLNRKSEGVVDGDTGQVGLHGIVPKGFVGSRFSVLNDAQEGGVASFTRLDVIIRLAIKCPSTIKRAKANKMPSQPFPKSVNARS